MILYLVSINLCSLLYSLPGLQLYLIFYQLSQFVPKDISHNPVLFQSTYGVFHYDPLFGMDSVFSFSSSDNTCWFLFLLDGMRMIVVPGNPFICPNTIGQAH
jgi:hypothetical protein